MPPTPSPALITGFAAAAAALPNEVAEDKHVAVALEAADGVFDRLALLGGGESSLTLLHRLRAASSPRRRSTSCAWEAQEDIGKDVAARRSLFRLVATMRFMAAAASKSTASIASSN